MKTILSLAFLLFLPLILVSQSLVFDFRTASVAYWQNEFGSINVSNYSLPDSRGVGIALNNVSGYGSEVNVMSRPFIYHNWTGKYLFK